MTTTEDQLADLVRRQTRIIELLTPLVEAARYATCSECAHNPCQGLRKALAPIDAQLPGLKQQGGR